MKRNRIIQLFIIALTLLAAHQSQADEKINSSSTSQLLKVPLSDYAMDYLPDLRFQFTS
jgi:hypothetical protein